MDGKEIARTMDITLGATYNLLSRATANLRRSLLPTSIITAIFGYWY